MRVFFTERAKKDWNKLDGAIQKQLRKKLVFYVGSGNPIKFADVLKNKTLGEYRFRIGHYRIIFDVQNGEIFILRVGHRKDIYR